MNCIFYMKRKNSLVLIMRTDCAEVNEPYSSRGSDVSGCKTAQQHHSWRYWADLVRLRLHLPPPPPPLVFYFLSLLPATPPLLPLSSLPWGIIRSPLLFSPPPPPLFTSPSSSPFVLPLSINLIPPSPLFLLFLSLSSLRLWEEEGGGGSKRREYGWSDGGVEV